MGIIMVKVSSIAKLKAENTASLDKSLSKMGASVKKTLDLKQVMLASKALTKYAKAQKKGPLSDDDALHLTVTMRKVPAKPSVKPIKIKLAKPFNCAENMTRACLIVKDPE